MFPLLKSQRREVCVVDYDICRVMDDLKRLDNRIVSLEVSNLTGKILYKFSKMRANEQDTSKILYEDLCKTIKSSKILSFENFEITVIDKQLVKLVIVNIRNDNFLIVTFTGETSLTDIVDVVSYVSNSIFGMNKQAS